MGWSPVRVGKNVSFEPIQIAALQWLAAREGHANVSRVLQRLLELEMVRLKGPHWRDEFAAEPEGSHTVVVRRA